jgi:hypothetical protein
LDNKINFQNTFHIKIILEANFFIYVLVHFFCTLSLVKLIKISIMFWLRLFDILASRAYYYVEKLQRKFLFLVKVSFLGRDAM